MMRAKLCGMKTLLAAKVAEEAGADFIGFIFWKQSQRYISPERAAVISSQIHQARRVGVFVDEDIDSLNAIARQVNLDYVQLHGHEDADYARRVERPVIKAYRYGDDFSVAAANAFPAELILVDAFRPGLVGGTGESFDWRAAAEEIAAIHKSVLIAGGINAQNVHEVEKIFHPFAVDVSGSLEVNHQKSIRLIKTFMKKIK